VSLTNISCLFARFTAGRDNPAVFPGARKPRGRKDIMSERIQVLVLREFKDAVAVITEDSMMNKVATVFIDGIPAGWFGIDGPDAPPSWRDWHWLETNRLQRIAVVTWLRLMARIDVEEENKFWDQNAELAPFRYITDTFAGGMQFLKDAIEMRIR
jgi:hypothetical protein